ncbi:MAG: ABC transporter permease [Pseudomonadales bacterium]
MSAQNFNLLLDFSRRDIQARYQTSHLGMLWMIITPLLTLGVYAFAFSTILGVDKLTGSTTDPMDYVLALFSGLLVFFFFSEVVSSSPDLISKKSNFVKKVVFPLPILVSSRVMAASLGFFVNIILLIVFIGIKNNGLPMSAVYLPIVLLPIVAMVLGLAFTISSFGVYLPDIGQITTPLMRMAFYLTPIVYPLTVIPEQYRAYFWINPMTSMVHHLKTVLIVGDAPNWIQLGWFYLAAIIILCLGYALFSRLRSGFADVI